MLIDGGQPATKVAAEIAAFLSDARTSLDLALYDVRLETEAGALVLASLLAAHQRGVRVRLLFDVDHPGPIPVPPPPETRPEAIEVLPIETRGIAGYVTAISGERYAVALLINGPRAEGARKAQDALLRWVYQNG